MEEWKDDIEAKEGKAKAMKDYNNRFIELITLLDDVIQFKNNNKIFSYTCYTGDSLTDGIILQYTKKHFDFINLMAYFDSIQEYEELYNTYKSYYDSDNIFIGVKAGADNDDSRTPVNIVKPLVEFKKNIKKGMMLWTLNRDCKKFTGKPDFTWLNLIN